MSNPLTSITDAPPGVPGRRRPACGNAAHLVDPQPDAHTADRLDEPGAHVERRCRHIRTRAALRDLAERNPRLLADTVVYLTGTHRDLAAAAVESVRLGHRIDEPLVRALEASAAAAGRAP